MAANKGHTYEVNAARALKKYKLMPQNAKPAGNMANKPDITLTYNGMKAGVELKTKGTSAGSVVVKYDTTDLDNPWKFDIHEGKDTKEKDTIIKIADENDILHSVKSYWKEIPYLRSFDPKWKATAGKLTVIQRYEHDLATFPNLRFDVPSTSIEKYYISKDVHYINIGIYGLYRLGNKNPLKLKGVPRFSDVATTEIRMRVQKKKVTGNYQFTCSLEFTIPAAKRSDFNLAPIKGDSVKVLEDQINLACFDKL